MDMTASVRTHQILYKQQHPLREHLLEHPLSTAEQHQCTIGKLQWGDGNRNFNFFRGIRPSQIFDPVQLGPNDVANIWWGPVQQGRNEPSFQLTYIIDIYSLLSHYNRKYHGRDAFHFTARAVTRNRLSISPWFHSREMCWFSTFQIKNIESESHSDSQIFGPYQLWEYLVKILAN